jgi:hypothetical protein
MDRSTFPPRTLCRTCANSLVREGALERRSLERTCAAGVELNALSGDCECYVRDPKLPPNVLSIRLEMPRPYRR